MFSRDQKPKTTTPDQKKHENVFFQPKLNFGKSGDKYEVEADKMADRVVNKSTNNSPVQKKETEEVQQKPLASQVTPIVQKMDGGDDEAVQQKSQEEEKPVQKKEEEEAVQSKEDEQVQTKKCGDCEKEQKIQKTEEEVQSKEVKTNSSQQQTGSFESKLRRGIGGQELDKRIKGEMESGFGADFSKVKIHNDSEAANMSSSIGAQAFTHGNDIYFNKGKYNPNSEKGKHLLAHELTHTIQQGGMEQKQIQKLSDPECSSVNSLPHSGSCRSGFVHTCYSETFEPSSSSALNVEVSVDYNTLPGPWLGPEDFSVQVFKCGFRDIRIGSKRLGPNIPGTLNFSIASVTAAVSYTHLTLPTTSRV